MPAPPPEKPGDDPAVHPFVNAFANIGAIMGRDLGVVALRSIEAQRGGTSAVLFWSAEDCPEAIKAKVPAEMTVGLYAVMIVPPKASVPGFLFTDADVQAAKVNLVDGSILVAFVRKSTEDSERIADQFNAG